MNVSDIIATIGLAISILGIPITFVLARRTRQRPELRYVVDFDVILNPNDNLFDRGLSMTLGDRPIDSISRSRVALWNHRGDTIHRSDNLGNDPLRLQLNKDDEALQARILSVSRKQTEVVAIINPHDPSSVRVDFEFLDAGDGAVIEFIHKGPAKPNVAGTLQGSDIRSAGSADLSPHALSVAAEKSRMRRLRTYSPKRIKRLLRVYAVQVVLVIILALIVVLTKQHQTNTLVNVHKYTLTTLRGQVAFANAVAKTRAYNSSIYLFTDWVLGVFVAFIISAGFAIYFIAIRRKIPQSIVQNHDPLNKSDGRAETI